MDFQQVGDVLLVKGWEGLAHTEMISCESYSRRQTAFSLLDPEYKA